MIKVAIVEDIREIRESLALIINDADGFETSGIYATAEEAIEKLPSTPPNVILMDINLPLKSGIECTLILKPLLPATQIIMLTMYDDNDTVFEALSAGATGYLLKRTPAPKILEAIQEVHAGGSPMSMQIARLVVKSFSVKKKENELREKLSVREREILDYLSRGKRYKEIADELFISVETVRSHCRKIYEKLQVHSAREAIHKYLER